MELQSLAVELSTGCLGNPWAGLLSLTLPSFWLGEVVSMFSSEERTGLCGASGSKKASGGPTVTA
jgi:hypothetical protein